MSTRHGVTIACVVSCLAACASPSAHPVVQTTPLVVDTSAEAMLQATWQSYTNTFINGGRVIDPHMNSNTTSEGQSYAMLRAVWMNDRPTFDTVWGWTRDNMWQESSHRFGWLWGAAAGSLQSGDSAADADTDIALALVFASHLWGGRGYLQWAQRVLSGIWQNEVVTPGGTPYLVAGNWAGEGTPQGPVLDPSYFAPYAYRIFAGVDTSHPWMSLVGSSYSALAACSRASLNTGHAVGLPPNWCVLNTSSGAAESFAQKGDGDAYGYDAFRVMFRVALDALWFQSSAARAYLASQQFLVQQWRQRGSLAAVYGHDGSAAASYEDPTVYGGEIAAFLNDPQSAADILHKKLLASFIRSGEKAYWGQPDNYYEQNWVWFGVALVTGQLGNLAA